MKSEEQPTGLIGSPIRQNVKFRLKKFIFHIIFFRELSWLRRIADNVRQGKPKNQRSE